MKLLRLILAHLILVVALCSNGASQERVTDADFEAARVDRKASELLVAGKIDESIQLVEGILKKSGYSNDAYSSLARTKGEALVTAGRFAEARAFTVECQKRGWDSPALTVLLGEMDIREWKWNDARTAFRKAYKAEPRILADNGNELIALEWATGQYDKALEMIAKAVEKGPASPIHEALFRDLALLLLKSKPQLTWDDQWLDKFSLGEFVGMPDADEAKKLDYCKRLLSFIAVERPRLRIFAQYRVLFLASGLSVPARAELVRHLDSTQFDGDEDTKKWLSERLQKKGNP